MLLLAGPGGTEHQLLRRLRQESHKYKAYLAREKIKGQPGEVSEILCPQGVVWRNAARGRELHHWTSVAGIECLNKTMHGRFYFDISFQKG